LASRHDDPTGAPDAVLQHWLKKQSYEHTWPAAVSASAAPTSSIGRRSVLAQAADWTGMYSPSTTMEP
jgi:hypothetical protein